MFVLVIGVSVWFVVEVAKLHLDHTPRWPPEITPKTALNLHHVRGRYPGALAIVLLLRCVDSMMIYTEAFTINAGGPNDATRFLTLELGEEIKGFSYGQAAARASLYFLIVVANVWAFVIASRRDEEAA